MSMHLTSRIKHLTSRTVGDGVALFSRGVATVDLPDHGLLFALLNFEVGV